MKIEKKASPPSLPSPSLLSCPIQQIPPSLLPPSPNPHPLRGLLPWPTTTTTTTTSLALFPSLPLQCSSGLGCVCTFSDALPRLDLTWW